MWGLLDVDFSAVVVTAWCVVGWCRVVCGCRVGDGWGDGGNWRGIGWKDMRDSRVGVELGGLFRLG